VDTPNTPSPDAAVSSTPAADTPAPYTPQFAELPPTLLERVPLTFKLFIALVAIAVLSVLFAGAHDAWFHWFEVHTGTVNESGPFYGFWSGFGSDIGEATLVVGVLAAWRHHNCHVARCPRLGRPVAGTPYVACPRHHPAHSGKKRSITHEMLHREYHAAYHADRGTKPPTQ
jgi:hypothetical protein